MQSWLAQAPLHLDLNELFRYLVGTAAMQSMDASCQPHLCGCKLQAA